MREIFFLFFTFSKFFENSQTHNSFLKNWLIKKDDRNKKFSLGKFGRLLANNKIKNVYKQIADFK